MDANLPSDQWVHRFTRRLRMRLPIGMSEAISICAEEYAAACDLIPEQVADDYVDARSSANPDFTWPPNN